MKHKNVKHSTPGAKNARETLERLFKRLSRAWKAVRAWSARNNIRMHWRFYRCEVCNGVVGWVTLDIGDHKVCQRLEEQESETPF